MSIRSAFRAQVLLGIAGLLAATMLALIPAGSAQAAESPASARAARNYFGAIAISADAATGYSYDYRTRKRAQNVAVAKCRQRSNYPGTCRIAGWMRNACGAVAVKYDSRGFVSRYKYGWAGTKQGAKNAARRNFGGQIRTFVCTTRYR